MSMSCFQNILIPTRPSGPLLLFLSVALPRKQTELLLGGIINSFITPQILNIYYMLNTVHFLLVGYRLWPLQLSSQGDQGQVYPCCWSSKPVSWIQNPNPTLFFFPSVCVLNPHTDGKESVVGTGDRFRNSSSWANPALVSLTLEAERRIC